MEVKSSSADKDVSKANNQVFQYSFLIDTLLLDFLDHSHTCLLLRSNTPDGEKNHNKFHKFYVTLPK